MALGYGIGDVLLAASSRGPTVYTTFIATRNAIARHRDEFAAMTRAIGRMQTWLADSLRSGGFISRVPRYEDSVELTLG